MAQRGSKKFRLLIYAHMLNRWWTVTLTLALTLFAYVGLLWGAEYYFSDPAQNPLPRLATTPGIVLLTAGGLSFVFTLFLITIRSFAYVQLFGDHLRLVTPFLRLNIAYKRIQRTIPAQMEALFPPRSLSSWQREIIAPLAGRTAIVLHLTAYPVARAFLSLFLSPFFFADKTTQLVLLVDDWMGLSTALESARISGKISRPQAKPKITSGLLDNLK
ncbi:MAG: hypothetical protein OHK0031_09430 [Anaerolineales bacterium]